MLHPILEAVFQSFDRTGVRWCVLRGEADLAAPTGVALLVAPADLRRVRQVLKALRFAPLPTRGRGCHAFLGYHSPTDRWIRLEVATELTYGPHFALQTRAALGCLARRQRAEAIAVLAPDDAFWTLLLHCLLDKGGVLPEHAARLQQLLGAARTDGPLAQVVERACPAGWNAARLAACVGRGDWSAPARIAPSLGATWARRDPIGTRRRSLVNRGLQWLEKPSLLLRRRGLSVAVLGPDGAGKSTLAAGIASSFYFPVRSVYMGLWQRGPADAGRRRVPGWDAATRALRVATRPLLIWWRYLTAQYHQALGRLVIFDRYIYDALLPRRHPLSRLNRLYYWLLGHACPAPDLVLVLDAPGKVMYARKGEWSPEDLEASRQDLLALKERIPQLQIVDASRGPDAVRAEAIERIWRRYVAHKN